MHALKGHACVEGTCMRGRDTFLTPCEHACTRSPSGPPPPLTAARRLLLTSGAASSCSQTKDALQTCTLFAHCEAQPTWRTRQALGLSPHFSPGLSFTSTANTRLGHTNPRLITAWRLGAHVEAVSLPPHPSSSCREARPARTPAV